MKLPKYFIVEKDIKNPLWKEYVNWINKTYCEPVEEYSWVYYIEERYLGYDGSKSWTSGTHAHNSSTEFENSPVTLTLEQWDEMVNRKKFPEYFAIKMDKGNPLWYEYIEWANKKYRCNWSGEVGASIAYYGWDGKDFQWQYNISNFKPFVKLVSLDEWNSIINKNNKTEVKNKLTIPATDVLFLHKIACSGWKETFAEYLKRIDKEQNITFTQQEVNNMFKAATAEQKPELERIFGKPKAKIELNKLTTGSKVMVEPFKTLGSATHIDFDKPLSIIFMNKPYYIDPTTGFTEGTKTYITFNQGGRCCWFEADEAFSCIIDVLKY